MDLTPRIDFGRPSPSVDDALKEEQMKRSSLFIPMPVRYEKVKSN